MAQNVVIKHNRYGIELVLNSVISFEELLASVIEKFKTSSNFFKDAKLAIAFKGRELSEEEIIAIIDAITENTSIQIMSIIENGTVLEELMRQQVEVVSEPSPSDTEMQKLQEVPEDYISHMPEQSIVSDFYIGTLRSGQVLECASSVTLIGDVNPGAKIISEGNIVVLGALKGNAAAGVSGNGNCFIFALDIEKLGVEVTTDADYTVKDADVVMGLRIQLERQKSGLFPSVREYHKLFGIDPRRVALAKDGAIVMHPGPVNRGVELAASVADGSQSVIQEQVTNGVCVRMAVLDMLTNEGGF